MASQPLQPLFFCLFFAFLRSRFCQQCHFGSPSFIGADGTGANSFTMIRDCALMQASQTQSPFVRSSQRSLPHPQK
jgi:hypothetical protein